MSNKQQRLILNNCKQTFEPLKCPAAGAGVSLLGVEQSRTRTSLFTKCVCWFWRSLAVEIERKRKFSAGIDFECAVPSEKHQKCFEQHCPESSAQAGELCVFLQLTMSSNDRMATVTVFWKLIEIRVKQSNEDGKPGKLTQNIGTVCGKRRRNRYKEGASSPYAISKSLQCTKGCTSETNKTARASFFI